MLPTHQLQGYLNLLTKYQQIKQQFNLNTTSLTPINYASEKQNFLNSTDSNPTFQYHRHDIPDFTSPLQQLISQLEKLNLPEDLYDYTSKCFQSLYTQLHARQAVGSKQFAALVDHLFAEYLPLPDIDISQIESQIHPYPHQRFFRASKIQALFKHTLENYQINNYEVIIDNHNPDTIRVGHKRIVIGKQVKRLARDVKRLIVHEIESHVLQRINQPQSEPFCHLTTFPDNALYSEGLATYNEIRAGLLTPNSYSNYYYRYLAIANRHMSFRDLYNFINQYVPTNRAFIITYRAKRGLSDTSQPGGFPKDAVYLLGYLKIQQFIENSGDITDLYVYRNPKLIELIKKYQLHQPNHSLILTPKFLLTA